MVAADVAVHGSFRSCDMQVMGATSEDGGGDASGTAAAAAAAQPRCGIVVFVKDQNRPEAAHRHLMPAAATGGDLVADSASNTDSGNGTSEYSDDASPPLINQATASAAAATRRHRITSSDSPSMCGSNYSPLFQLYTVMSQKKTKLP